MKVVGKVVGDASLNWSSLERLACRFHQDFGLEGVDAQTAAARHVEGLSGKDRQLLIDELTRFLENHPGRSNKGITNAWIKMGAQWWPQGPPTREVLSRILGML